MRNLLFWGGKNFDDTTAEDKDLIDIFDHVENFMRSQSVGTVRYWYIARCG